MEPDQRAAFRSELRKDAYDLPWTVTETGHRFDRGGADDGLISVTIEVFYGGRCVALRLAPAVTAAYLDAATARALAADLVAHADALENMPQ